MKKLLRLVIGGIAALTLMGGSCDEEAEDIVDPDEFDLTVLLINEDLENIHIFRDVHEDFSPANRLEPGGQRTLITGVEPGDQVTFIAGRNGERFDEHQCTADFNDAPSNPPRVIWGGNPLSPSLSCSGWSG